MKWRFSLFELPLLISVVKVESSLKNVYSCIITVTTAHFEESNSLVEYEFMIPSVNRRELSTHCVPDSVLREKVFGLKESL